MTLKEKIKNGKSICGTLVNMPAISVVEMMGYFDYDYLWIDLEHSAITLARGVDRYFACQCIDLY